MWTVTWRVAVAMFICFCQQGYALDVRTLYAPPQCVDIDECVLQLDNCVAPAKCVNTAGSYACRCPLEYKLSEDGTECLDTGLICTSRLCNDQGCPEPVLEYCDDTMVAIGVSVDRNLQHCLTSYMKASNNTLTPHLSSCFFIEDRENKCTPGVCILKAVEDTNYYQCCCTGNRCNENIFFPSEFYPSS